PAACRFVTAAGITERSTAFLSSPRRQGTLQSEGARRGRDRHCDFASASQHSASIRKYAEAPTSLDRPKPSRRIFLISVSSFCIRSRCSSYAAIRLSGLTLTPFLASRSKRDQT